MKHRVAPIEVLEARIAPAKVIAVDNANHLFSFDSATPNQLSADVSITGLSGTERIVALDFRPLTGVLYGLAIDDPDANPDNGRLYSIDATTGAATAVGTNFGITLTNGASYGFDFNPVVDRIRIVNSADQNFRVNPDTGAVVATDTTLDNAADTEDIRAVAYSNSYASAGLTTLYGLDFANDQTVRIGGVEGSPSPNGGVLTAVGKFGVNLTTTGSYGFDVVSYLDGDQGFASTKTTTTGKYFFFRVNLTTGGFSNGALIGNGTRTVEGFAIQPDSGLTPLNASTATYTDSDGDLVTVKVSKGTLTSANFQMVKTADGARAELRVLDLSSAQFAGANVTITAKKVGTAGDGLVNVGRIIASGVDLGAVKVGGGLAEIISGDGNASQLELKSLTVQTLGRRAADALNFAPKSGSIPVSNFPGKVGPITITGDMVDTTFIANSGTTFTVGKSMIGGALSGNFASVKIGGSVDGIVQVSTPSLTIGGDVRAGSGSVTGFLNLGPTGTVKIGGDLLGGSDSTTGQIIASSIKSLTIVGDVLGGAGADSGSILLGTGGTVKIGGSVHSGSGPRAGQIAATTLKSLTIGGSLLGTTSAPATIQIQGKLNPATAAEAMAVGTLTIGGSLDHARILGGADGTGTIVHSDVILGKITIGGDFSASDIAVGIKPDTDGFFHNAVSLANSVNFSILATIASVTIKGAATGTSTALDGFGIYAQSIGAAKVAGRAFALTAGASEDFTFGTFSDLRLREV